jgi:CubicO group peptidase (beta-lactamase class C family)
MAQRVRGLARARLDRQQTLMAAIRTIRTTQARRVTRQALMVAMGATVARMAAHQRHQLVSPLPAQTHRTQHLVAQEAGCGHNETNVIVIVIKYKTLVNSSAGTMNKILALIFTSFIIGTAVAEEVATVDPVKHSGGLAKLTNNRVFPASENPIPLPNKTLSEADQKIVHLANQLIDSNATTALLLIEKGKIVFEKYKAPANVDAPLFSQSMSKSLTAYTIGQLLCEGKINSLDARADTFVPELKGTVFGESSIKDLLTMSSGAKDGITSGQTYAGEWMDVVYKGVTTESILKKYGQRDVTFFGNPLPGGAEFRYKAVDTYTLEHVADRTGNFFNTFEKTIWNKSRPQSKGYWLYDSAKHAQSASGSSFVGRDWARLAMHSVNELKHGSPCMQNFMKAATTMQLPNSSKRIGKAFKGYGYQTWIADFGGKASYWWVGYGGQRVGVDPESEKILVLTSHREDYMDSVYKLFSAWQKSN